MANRFPLIFNSGAGQIQELAASDNLDLTSSNLVNAGILFTSSGSATAPSLQIGSGTTYNPGLYSPGADQLAVSTAGVQRINIEADGDINIDGGGVFYDATNNRLAIGTTSPSSLLHVEGTAGNAKIRLGTGGDHTLIGPDVAGHTIINAATSGANMVLQIAGSTKATLDSSGRLLVGTSSARTGFQISTGFGNVTPVHQFEFNSQTYNGLSITHNAGANVYPAVLAFGKSRGSSAGSYTAVASGDGLGWLDFYGADGTNMVRAATIAAEVDGTPGANDMPGRLVFSTTPDGGSSPTEAMRITNAKSFRFCMESYSSGAGSTNYGWNLEQNTTQPFINHAVNGTSLTSLYAMINDNGIVGTIKTTGSSTQFNTSSDYRLKENITTIANSINRLQQLKPCQFNFIANPAEIIDGFIAHEVQDVVSAAISGEKDAVNEDGSINPQGIDQSKLVPLLTAALQEAIAKIESLEARLTAAGI